jgi:hypothetical protein
MINEIGLRELAQDIHDRTGTNIIMTEESNFKTLGSESARSNNNEKTKKEEAIANGSSSRISSQTSATSQTFKPLPPSEALFTLDTTPSLSESSLQDRVQQTPVPSPSSAQELGSNTKNISATQTISQKSQADSTLARFLPTITILAVSNRTSLSSKGPIASTLPLSANRAAGNNTGDAITILPKLSTTVLATSVTGAENSTYVRPTPAVAFLHPLPGKNQPIPVLDNVAGVPSEYLAGPEPTSMPEASQWFDNQAPSGYSSLPISTQAALLSSSYSIMDSPSTSIPSPSSFITLTKSRQEEQQLSSTAASQSTTVSASMTAAPTEFVNVSVGADNQLERVSRLTPVARTLFIVLGVLGTWPVKSEMNMN